MTMRQVEVVHVIDDSEPTFSKQNERFYRTPARRKFCLFSVVINDERKINPSVSRLYSGYICQFHLNVITFQSQKCLIPKCSPGHAECTFDKPAEKISLKVRKTL